MEIIGPELSIQWLSRGYQRLKDHGVSLPRVFLHRRSSAASSRAPPGRRLAVEGFVVSGLLGMLLAQLVGPPRSADSGAVKRERRQRGRIDPKQPLRQPPFSDASVSNRTSFSATYEILGSAANRIRSQRGLSKHCSVEDLALRC